MAKIILKTILWGVGSWLLLSVILFFGIGLYQGLAAGDSEVELSPAVITSSRYAVLLLSLGIAAAVFVSGEKKQKLEFHGTFMPPRPINAQPEPKLPDDKAEEPRPWS